MTGHTSGAEVAACISLAIALFGTSLIPFFLFVEVEHLVPRVVRELPAAARPLLRDAAISVSALLLLPSSLRPEGSGSVNRIRLHLHRMFRRPVTTGPVRLYTRRVPDGVFLDLEEYFTRVITTLADDPDALDLLMEIAEDRGLSRGHDGWEPEELLMERLADLIGYEVPVRGKQLARLADRLRAAVPAPAVVIPAQREAGAV